MNPLVHPSAADAELVARWRRLEMHVRCALWPGAPGRIRLYVQAGMLAVRRGAAPAVDVHARALDVLLRTSRDAALPWFWRSVCLEHVHLPLAQLRSHLRLHEPMAFAAIEHAVQRAQADLPSPGAGRDAST